ncbi:MAG: cobalamin-dependent protein [Candidatus Bathyarchaeota archaeon]|nr:cobalamin-dependent protein [Candidatus Bathyarchaeota archaeon]
MTPLSLEDLLNAFVNLEEEKVIRIVENLLREGRDPSEILDVCRRAASLIGERFERCEYFLSELVFAGEIFNSVMRIVLPELKREVKPAGTIVLGTVQGDIHDIGKNIFKAFAEAAGFRVIDLGVDVPPERFVEAVRSHNPDIVGMSGLLTISYESMKKTVEALREAGLRDRVKVIIGGGRVDEYVKRYTGADEWADNAMLGVRKCKEILGLEE